MQSRIEIAIDAPAARVFELAREVPRWPEMLPHYTKVTVLSHDADTIVAEMRAVRPTVAVGIPVWWRARFWADGSDTDDLRLRFVHVAGATKGMDVTWHICPTRAGGSTARIEHVFSRALPFLGAEWFPRAVDRLFVRPIAGRTLAAFKRLAEESA